MPSNDQVTELLRASRLGDQDATGQLMPLVYDRLHALAGSFMRRERPNHTLSATALIHEAYMKIVGAEVEWEDRAHFFSVAARTMRNILVDYAKARNRAKRGGGIDRVPFDDNFHQIDFADPKYDSGIVELDEALSRLALQDARKAQVIELLYFGGLTYEETARTLGVSPVTIHREARMAKAWLRTALDAERG